MIRCTLLLSIALLGSATHALAQQAGEAEDTTSSDTPADEPAPQSDSPSSDAVEAEASSRSQPVDQPSEPSDAARARAREHFRMGVEFYKERNFRAALIEFKRAYRTAPHYKLLFNLGQASVQVQEYAAAIDYLTSYLRAGGDEIDVATREEVETMLDSLRARIATVTVETEPGAEIFVDDVLVGRAPLDRPLRVGAGRHRFSAAKPGFERVDRVRDVAAGDHLTVDLTLGAPLRGTIAASGAPDLQLSQDEGGVPASTWALIATGTLGAAAGTLAVLSALAAQDYDEERRVETTKASLDALSDKAHDFALATDILLGATLVSGVVTTVLWLTEDSGSASEEPPAAANAGLQLRVGLGHAEVTGAF